jgi:hypothetical protein
MASLGDPLYIKSKDTKVLKQPNAASDSLVMLKPGDRVIWLGEAPGSNGFHKVQVGGVIGFVLKQNLSTNPKPAGLEDLFKCRTCGGLGYLPFPASLAGFEGMAVHPTCNTCKGTGSPPPMSNQAFPSHGAGTKG